MQDYPLISVVIPSFNQGQFIEQTILSVIGQHYPNLEVLVLDGGSTDNTVDILQKYSQYLDYWHSQKDGGQADAINKGMELSSGDIVCWLNSDDMYLPGSLLDIGERFRGRTHQKLLIHGGALVAKEDSQGNFINAKAQLSAPLENPQGLTYKNFMVQPSAFWTRHLWEVAGVLNPAYSYILDWEWFIRASQKGHFEYVPKYYSVYRYHPDHKTTSGGDKKLKEILEIIENYSSNNLKNVYKQIYQNRTLIQNRLNLYKKIKLYGLLKRIGFKNPIRLLFPTIGKTVKSDDEFWKGMNLLHMCRNNK